MEMGRRTSVIDAKNIRAIDDTDILGRKRCRLRSLLGEATCMHGDRIDGLLGAAWSHTLPLLRGVCLSHRLADQPDAA